MTRVLFIFLFILSTKIFAENRCYAYKFSRGKFYDLKVFVKEENSNELASVKIQLGKLIPGQYHNDQNPRTINSYEYGTCNMENGECLLQCKTSKITIIDSLKINFGFLSTLTSNGKKINCESTGENNSILLQRAPLEECGNKSFY
ncbi:MAG: hypothetical protein H6622_11175 [Halobacteriovoraceae bacterium]|nr:hypothetical protein [Halobacteriovoraceae bacterium]